MGKFYKYLLITDKNYEVSRSMRRFFTPLTTLSTCQLDRRFERSETSQGEDSLQGQRKNQ